MIKYTTEQIEEVRLKLRELPEIEKTKKVSSKSETIKMISNEIRIMQGQGHTLEKISSYLRGMETEEIGTPNLIEYMKQQNEKALANTAVNKQNSNQQKNS